MTMRISDSIFKTKLVCFTLVLLLASAVGAQEPASQQSDAAEPEAVIEVGQKADPKLALDEIVNRHLQARFPETEVQSVVAEGNLVFMGLQLPMTITIARPRAARLEADMAGSPMILAFDGEDGWTVSPLQGIPTPEPLEEEAEEAVALFADFFWGFLAERDTADGSIVFRGIEKAGNDEAYALELGGDSPRTLFIGGSDFLERRLLVEAVFMGTAQKLDVMLGDYREIDGLMIPFDIQLLSGGAAMAQVVLRDAKLNQQVDPSIFELPPPPEPVTEAEAEPGSPASEPGDKEPPVE